MATADTARLVAELSLKDKGFSKGIDGAVSSLGKLDSTMGRISQKASQGAKTLGKNLALIGVGATGLAAVAVKSGLQDLATLESAITSVDGAIAQMGLTGQTTGKEIADWANEIEANVEAAFDDKEITASAATLIRYGKVSKKNLKPALVVMTDLAAKTGDVESASELLAKALADPAKAAGKLSRQGIILTKAQQDQIKAMTEVNDIAGAQALLLDIVAKSTAGAAKASAGPYQDALNKTADAAEDARKALAIGFLPVITKVADLLQKGVSDPKFIAGLESFGKTLAGGLDSLISVAQKLPWDAIGTSLQLGGLGAKAILDAFVGLPPWVQTAVITGWGLNKLTGGALGGIVGELGKGLIKGVLGMNAGVVHITAGTVTGVGGVPTPGGPAGGGIKGALGTAAKLAGAAVIPVAIVSVAEGAKNELFPDLITPQKFLPPEPAGGAKPFWELIGKGNEKLKGTINEGFAKEASRQNITNERLEAIKAKQTTSAALIAAKLGTTSAAISASMNGAKAAIVAAQRAAGQQTAFAIRDQKPPQVRVQNFNTVNTSVSVRETIKGQTTFKSYYKTIR